MRISDWSSDVCSSDLGPDRHVGDRVRAAGHVLVVRQVPIEDVELALGLHRETVDGVFDLDRRIGVEMPEAAAEIGGAAHLPEQPVQAFRARRRSEEHTSELQSLMRISYAVFCLKQ